MKRCSTVINQILTQRHLKPTYQKLFIYKHFISYKLIEFIGVFGKIVYWAILVYFNINRGFSGQTI